MELDGALPAELDPCDFVVCRKGALELFGLLVDILLEGFDFSREKVGVGRQLDGVADRGAQCLAGRESIDLMATLVVLQVLLSLSALLDLVGEAVSVELPGNDSEYQLAVSFAEFGELLRQLVAAFAALLSLEDGQCGLDAPLHLLQSVDTDVVVEVCEDGRQGRYRDLDLPLGRLVVIGTECCEVECHWISPSIVRPSWPDLVGWFPASIIRIDASGDKQTIR